MGDNSRPGSAGTSPAGPADEDWGAWDGSSVYAGAPGNLRQGHAVERPRGQQGDPAYHQAAGQAEAGSRAHARSRDQGSVAGCDVRAGTAAVITRGSGSPYLRPSAPCLDCGWLTCRHDEPGEWYVVTDQVWRQAGMTDTRQWLSEHPGAPIGPAGGLNHYLCIGCLEARLGRRLAPADFPGLPINLADWHRKTARLADRLGGAPSLPVSTPRAGGAGCRSLLRYRACRLRHHRGDIVAELAGAVTADAPLAPDRPL